MDRNKNHVWISDNPVNPERVTYSFFDPATQRTYNIVLRFCSEAQCWDTYLCYDNGEPDGYCQWISPYLRGFYSYQDLTILKIDLITCLSVRFRQVTGWNDDFHYDLEKPIEIHYLSPLYPKEFFNYFDYDLTKDDAPFRLYALGDIRLLRKAPLFRQRVAIIGSRTPDEQGVDAAYRLGQYHSSEIVVSGLAIGIDTATHRGCIDAGGDTIAVVGTGLDRVHPKENKILQENILDSSGLILSEQPNGTKASPRTLVARTRIQMALADKIVVVECERESGTMHAVRFAQKFGKPIFALDCDWSGNRYLIDNKIAKSLKIK